MELTAAAPQRRAAAGSTHQALVLTFLPVTLFLSDQFSSLEVYVTCFLLLS